jgi:hypothetical protein
MKWVEEVLRPGIALTKQENAPIVPGSHCRFCPALTTCKKATEQVMSTVSLTAKEVFSDAPLTLPDPKNLTNEQIAKLYEFSEMFESWLKSVKETTNARVLSGEKIPGLKAVLGNRRKAWNSPIAAEEFLRKSIGSDAYETKILTPAKALKKFEELGADVEKLRELFTETRSKTIVPETDKRPALCIENAAEAFS